MLALLLALAQSPDRPPTVGDTVWLTRHVALPANVTVRPRPITATPAFELLGSPEVTITGREARIAFPLVVWRPGRHRIEVPGPIVVRPDGWSDTLPAATLVVEVASVLPPSPRDSLDPRPALDLMPLTRRSAAPVLLALGIAVLPLGVLQWWWRRRPKVPLPVRHDRPGRPPDPDRLEHWMAAGEYRAAALGWQWLVAARSRGHGDADPLLARLRAARFADEGSVDLTALCREARDWIAARGAGT